MSMRATPALSVCDLANVVIAQTRISNENICRIIRLE